MDLLSVTLADFVAANPKCSSTAAELREILNNQDIDLNGMDDLTVEDFKGIMSIQIGM